VPADELAARGPARRRAADGGPAGDGQRIDQPHVHRRLRPQRDGAGRQLGRGQRHRRPDGLAARRAAVRARPALLVADCDLAQARDKSIGPRNDVLADRRPELYTG
jgi:hypothetical protein